MNTSVSSAEQTDSLEQEQLTSPIVSQPDSSDSPSSGSDGARDEAIIEHIAHNLPAESEEQAPMEIPDFPHPPSRASSHFSASSSEFEDDSGSDDAPQQERGSSDPISPKYKDPLFGEYTVSGARAICEEITRTNFLAAHPTSKDDCGMSRPAITTITNVKAGSDHAPRRRSKLSMSADEDEGESQVRDSNADAESATPPSWQQPPPVVKVSNGHIREAALEYLRKQREKMSEKIIVQNLERDGLYATDEELHALFARYRKETQSLRRSLVEWEKYAQGLHTEHEKELVQQAEEHTRLENKRVQYLKDMYEECQNDYEECQDDYNEATANLYQVEKENKGLSEQIAELEAQLVGAGKAHSQLKQELAQVMSSSGECHRCPIMRKDIDRLQAALAALKARSHGEEADTQECAKLAANIKQLETDLQRERILVANLREQQIFSLAISSFEDDVQWPREQRDDVAKLIADYVNIDNHGQLGTELVKSWLDCNHDIQKIMQELHNLNLKFKEPSLVHMLLFSGSAFNIGLVMAKLGITGPEDNDRRTVTLNDHLKLAEELRTEWTFKYRGLVSRVNDAEYRYEQLHTAYEESLEHIETLKTLNGIKEALSARPDLTLDYAASEKQVQRQAGTIEQLVDQMHEGFQVLQKRNYELNKGLEEVGALRKENAKLREEIQSLRQRDNNAQDAKAPGLVRKIRRLQELNVKATSKTKTSRLSQADKEDFKILIQACNRHKAIAKKAQQEIRSLVQTRNEDKAAATQAQLQLQELSQTNEYLTHTLQVKSGRDAEHRELVIRHETCKDVREHLEKQLVDYKPQQSHAPGAGTTPEQTSICTEETARNKAKDRSIVMEHAGCKATISGLTKEIQQTKNQLSKAERDATFANDRRALAETDNYDTKSELCEARAKIAHLEAALKALKKDPAVIKATLEDGIVNELTGAKMKITAREQEVKALQATVVQLVAERAQNQEQLRVLSEDYEEAKIEYAHASKLYQSSAELIKALNDQIAGKTNIIKAACTVAAYPADLRTVYSDLPGAVKVVRDQRDQANNTVVNLTAQLAAFKAPLPSSASPVSSPTSVIAEAHIHADESHLLKKVRDDLEHAEQRNKVLSDKYEALRLSTINSEIHASVTCSPTSTLPPTTTITTATISEPNASTPAVVPGIAELEVLKRHLADTQAELSRTKETSERDLTAAHDRLAKAERESKILSDISASRTKTLMASSAPTSSPSSSSSSSSSSPPSSHAPPAITTTNTATTTQSPARKKITLPIPFIPLPRHVRRARDRDPALDAEIAERARLRDEAFRRRWEESERRERIVDAYLVEHYGIEIRTPVEFDAACGGDGDGDGYGGQRVEFWKHVLVGNEGEA